MAKKIFSLEVAKARLDVLLGEIRRRRIVENFNYFPKQLEAIQAIAGARLETGLPPRILYGGALGGGKSRFLCQYAVEQCEKIPGSRWYLCRKEAAAFMRTTYLTITGLSPDGVDILNRPGWNEALSRKYFYHTNGSRIDYGGLGGDKLDEDKVKSMNLSGCGIDEASEVDEPVAKMLLARVGRIPQAAGHEVCLLASNPDQCWLIPSYLHNPKPGWVYVPSLMTDNKYLSEAYQASVKDVYEEMPEYYDALVHGNWAAVGAANKVFVYEQILEAMARKPEDTHRAGCQLGIDVAGMGDDSTVVAANFKSQYQIINKFKKQKAIVTAEYVIEIYETLRPTAILVDDVGYGGRLTDLLATAGLPVFGITAHGRAINNPNRFVNFKTEYFWNFREDILAECNLPNDPALREQMSNIRYILRNGKTMIEPKDAYKTRAGMSPDEMDAVMLSSIDLLKYWQPSEYGYVNSKVNISDV